MVPAANKNAFLCSCLLRMPLPFVKKILPQKRHLYADVREKHPAQTIISPLKYIMLCKEKSGIIALRVINLYRLKFWLCLHATSQGIFPSGSWCEQIISSIIELCSSDLSFVKAPFNFSSERDWGVFPHNFLCWHSFLSPKWQKKATL